MTTMSRAVAFGIGLVAALTAAPASAQEPPDTGPVVSGPQSSPPQPEAPTTGEPPWNDRQRWIIRGCPVGTECAADIRRTLKEFEARAFPRPRTSPWMDGDDRRGHNARRQGKAAARPPGRVIRGQNGTLKPSELRPDLPWLDDLALPDLPVRWDERIIKYLEFYKSDPRGRRIMAAWLRAQGRYRDLIVDHLRRARLPEDLLYVAMIESSYSALEYSRTGASGLWQFMPAGGRIYGLEQNRWIDERNDPIKATKAVMHYFTDLHHRFGDWALALTAFNAGYGGVLRSMAKYNTNDFWQLLEYENALPWESQRYYPKAVAAAIVGKNRALFGFDKLKSLPPIAYDEVEVPKSVTLAIVARAAGVKTEDIELLNPHLRRGRTPPGLTDYLVRIPRGRRDQFARRFPQLRGDWDTVDAYVVRHGERFEDIATTFGISRRKLRDMNGIKAEAEISGGTVIVVPRVAAEQRAENRATATEDLYAAGVPAGKPGDKLLVAVPDPGFRVKGKKRVFYRVVSGDSQYAIANAFGVSRHDLAGWNRLAPEAHLSPRMVLQVWVDPDKDLAGRNIKVLDPGRLHVVKAGSVEHIELAEKRVGRRRIQYTADKAESFEDIGKKFGLSRYDLARINTMPSDTVLEAGQSILVYEVVDPSASRRAQIQDAQAKAAQKPKRKPRKRGNKRRR